MMKFRSNGNLQITGEYLVLSGAQILATPLKSGQTMLVEESESNNLLEWTVSDIRGKWFNVNLSLPDLEIIKTSDPEKAESLKKILIATRELNTDFLSSDQGYWVDNQLEFERNWGMGSNATFIANLAQWARVDPFQIHKRVSIESGYDIACAISEKPIIFHRSFEKQSIDKINWIPSYKNHLAFIYLGEKHKEDDSIINYHNLDFRDQELNRISGITDELWLIGSETDLISRVVEHEEIMARILKQTTIQNQLFRDFNGAVKSLGKWNSGFVMAVGRQKIKKMRKYFQSKGYNTIFSWDDLIID